VAELGEGPLGSLWAAVVTSGAEQGRVVAVRRLSDLDQPARERLRLAGETAMQLRHARLVATLDVVDQPRGLAVVTEHVDGELLSVLLRSAAVKRAPLPPATALRIAFDVLTALRAARDLWTKSTPLSGPDPERLLRAVYGGITPTDIIVASYGDTVLCNVGVAGMAAHVQSVGRHPEFLCYRAPEQLDPGAIVDERADVFSVGVIVWEMLAHRPLFGSERRYHGVRGGIDPATEAKEIEDRVRSLAIPTLDAIPRTGPPIPKTVVDIVARALERKPQDRFATLEHMSEALRALSRESIATAEQVVMAVDRLAREAIDARRAALEIAVGYRAVSDSKPPPSNRPTLRPPPPQAPERIVSDARVHVPRSKTPAVRGGTRPKEAFGTDEAATLERHSARTKAPAIPARNAVSGRNPGAPPPPLPARSRAEAATPAIAAFPAAGAPSPEPAPEKPNGALDPAVSAARALFEPKAEDDFSGLPTEAGVDGVPPPPPALTRSKPPSAPPAAAAEPAAKAAAARAARDFESDAGTSAAAISVSAPRAAGRNRTLVIGIAAVAAMVAIGAILALSGGSSDAPPAKAPEATKAPPPSKRPAPEEARAAPTPAPVPEPAAPSEPEAPAETPTAETAPAAEDTPSEPAEAAKPTDHARTLPDEPRTAPPKPKPQKESFRPRGI
jgi:serine/threonine-protein kinase